MMIEEAISEACATVGILPPKGRAYGKWMQTDTLAGKKGKGDGRVIINDAHVTAFNWQTGETATVGLRNGLSRSERKDISHQITRQREEQAAKAAKAARIAAELVRSAKPGAHPYLRAKGFPDERALVLDAERIRRIGGAYLVPESAKSAIIMPARRGAVLTSVQLIWENGDKKFLAGGEIGGASHRIARGVDTWLCEGLATGLSLRLALRGLGRSDTILCCFSASNVPVVCQSVEGRCFIASDHDKPLEQFGGKGAGEHYALLARRPFLMPPEIGDDLNDLHMGKGIFAVQRLVTDMMRGAPR
ncbi:hypothetical protein EMQ25_05630 [Arsenicitalea aurantiaca]|uniref:Toprim domain-containing protein n=1 Tax=Arsenicitalea aurantiaca TaxID=1783274 RepID=A0A433XFA5_9HYPH|nr:hypothetical protein [Arsenicitalea aurantiaca]RUT32628.1 hypothetical protein EMQ25_05630 [Arsenicitalea aurantiaca]